MSCFVVPAANGMEPDSAAVAAAPAMMPAVAEIVRLVQAKVSDDTILAYIRYAPRNYALDADEILYLKQQGVSEAVIMAMMIPSAPSTAPMSTATVPLPTTPAPAPVPVSTDTGAGYDAPTYYYNDYAPDYYPIYGGYYGWPNTVIFYGGRWHHWGNWGGWRGGAGGHGGPGIWRGTASAGWHGNINSGGWHGNVGGGGWHGSAGGSAGFGGGHFGGRR